MTIDDEDSHKEEKEPALPGPWAKTYAAETKTEMLDAYKDWAMTYDEDSVVKFGYVAPKRASQVLSEYLLDKNRGFISSRSSKQKEDYLIADIGAGTGLVGQSLFDMGYKNLVAFDYSNAMLQIAQRKACYTAGLYCVDLQQNSPHDILQITGGCYGSKSFDVAISVGTFTPKHVGVEALLTVIKLIKSGGILVLSLRDDFVFENKKSNNGFLAKLEELESQNVLNREHVTEPELYTSKVSQSIYFRCWIFTVL